MPNKSSVPCDESTRQGFPFSLYIVECGYFDVLPYLK